MKTVKVRRHIRKISNSAGSGNFYREKQIQKLERYKELAIKTKIDADKAYHQSSSIADMIPFGQPILVGHHSEKRHRRDIERIHNLMGKSIELSKKAEYYEKKAENIANPKTISSDDPDAISKLKLKLQEMENERESIKARVHEAYELSNLAGNIRRVKERITYLENLKSIPEINETINGVNLSVDKIENRVKLSFDGKPRPEIIAELKRNGFHWSPYNKVWQRMISDYSIDIAREIINKV